MLGAIVVFHIVLCLWFHSDRAFLGDEWGSLDAVSQPYSFLLTHFAGWRTMNFYLAGLKFIHDQSGSTNWLLVLPGIVAGSWLVLLVAAIALRLGSGMRTALVAALLTAMNPWIVSYAVTIRSYIFLAAFASAMFLSLLDWHARGRWRDGLLGGFWGAMALLMHLNAIYSFAAVGTLAAGWTVARLRSHEPAAMTRLLRLTIPATLLIGLAAAAHLPMYADIVTFRGEWSAKAPTSLTYLPKLGALFFGGGYLILPVLGAIFYGSWRAVRDRSSSQYLIAMVIVPAAALSLAGVSHYAHAYARFLIAILPMLILLMGYGIGSAQTRVGVGFSCGLLLAVSFTQAIELRDAQRRAVTIPFYRLADAVSPAPAARSILLGPDVHSIGLRLSGVHLEKSIVAALNSVGPSEPICLNLIDLLDYTWGARGVDIGRARVAQVTGTPRHVADRLISVWQSRLGAKRGPSDPQAMARELSALLRWRGDAAAAAKYDAIGQRPMPPVESRVR